MVERIDAVDSETSRRSWHKERVDAREKKREAEKKKRRKRGRDNSVYNEGGIQIPAVPPGNERLTGNEREREREKTDIVVERGEERRGWNAHKEADRGISHKARNLEATMNESWRSEGGENGI